MGYCVYDNEQSNYVECEGFLDYLNDCQGPWCSEVVGDSNKLKWNFENDKCTKCVNFFRIS